MFGAHLKVQGGAYRALVHPESRSPAEPQPLDVDQRNLARLRRHSLLKSTLVVVNSKGRQRQLQAASCSKRASCYCSCTRHSITCQLQRRSR